MSKTLIAAMILSLPLLSLAQSSKAAPSTGKKPAPAASVPAAPVSSAAPQTQAVTTAALRRNQSRGPAMSDCTKKAADQKLQGVERKQFIGACVNSK